MTGSNAYQLEVRQVLDEVKDFVSSGAGGLSEADTRALFIDPILRALGYRGVQDIRREVRVRESRELVDYVLSVGSQPRVGVEAKAIGLPLTDSDAGQVVQYCSILGIEWAVVTNAQEWWLYHQFAQAPLSGKLVFRLNLVGWSNDAEFQSLFDQPWLLSKEAFETSEGPRAWLRTQQLDAALRDALTNPGSREVVLLQENLQRQNIDASAEDIAAWARSRLLEPTPIPASEDLRSEAILRQPTTQESQPERDRPIPVEPPVREFWIVPVAGHPNTHPGLHKAATAEETLRYWLDTGKWGFYESTPLRRQIRVGDMIAFYATGKGVRAFAEVAGSANVLISPEEWPEPSPQEKPVYKLPLKEIHWLDRPLEINAELRGGSTHSRAGAMQIGHGSFRRRGESASTIFCC